MNTRSYIWTVVWLYLILKKVQFTKTQFQYPTQELVRFNSAIPLREEDEDLNPETSPGLFEGDIAIHPRQFISLRLGVNLDNKPELLWPNGIIPFEISDLYSQSESEMIIRAIKIINALTCVKFRPYDGVEEDYVMIKSPEVDPMGCWSYIGRWGGEQIISLQKPDNRSIHCFGSEGRIMHELVHSIGFFHEQSRADRDKYVIIHWDNVKPAHVRNFKVIPLGISRFVYNYDYYSILHYGRSYFSQDSSKPTISVRGRNYIIGQRMTLSRRDCLRINELYGCLNGQYERIYRSICYLLVF